jgi:hypothetical protein
MTLGSATLLVVAESEPKAGRSPKVLNIERRGGLFF